MSDAAAGEAAGAAGLALQHRLADRLVYSKVKERLGGRLRIANAGGAPLSREIAEFFHSIDILILEGYGLSEVTTAATVNRPDAFKFGTVGKPMPGVELRFAADGEILIRSNTVFAGYYRDPEATAEVLDAEGFVHTGDIGHLDEDGFLVITDRKKDIIVTAGGKNVAPQNLENELKTHAIVSQALVDRRPPAVHRRADHARSRTSRVRRARGRGRSRAVDAVNEGRSRYEQIKRFAILPRDFSIERDELTPTLKLRRKVILEHFAAEVEALYAEPERELEDAAGADVGRRVPALVEARDLDDVAGVRGVHELAAADVDADVAEPVEEDEVARLQLVLRDRRAHAVLRVGRVRQRDADCREGVDDEAGAVEAVRAGAAPDVRLAELRHRDADDAAVARRRRDDGVGLRRLRR